MRGVHVIMGVRNLDTASKVKEGIIKEIPTAQIDVMEIDVSSLESVRKFASDFNTSGLPLNILANNAGIMASPYMLSKDNNKLQFATNYLGHFLLTNHLLDNMKKTAIESKKEGRIAIVSSYGHTIAYKDGIRFDELNDKASYNSWGAYGQSKLANVLHARELSRRLKEEGVDITANAVHPGAINANLFRHNSVLEAVFGVIGRFVLKSVQQGAATTCYVALNPQVKGISGEYFENSNLGKTNSKGQDMELAKKLWDFSIDLV